MKEVQVPRRAVMHSSKGPRPKFLLPPVLEDEDDDPVVDRGGAAVRSDAVERTLEDETKGEDVGIGLLTAGKDLEPSERHLAPVPRAAALVKVVDVLVL